MNNPWITLFLLALAAGFLPWQFSAEILILRRKHGLGRAAAFAGGIMFWRFLIGIALTFILAGGLIAIGNGTGPVQMFIRSGFQTVAEDIKNRQVVVLDILLMMSGIVLVLRSIRAGVDETDPDASPPKILGTLDSIGVRGAFGFGIIWMTVSVAQWTFLIAGVQQILDFDGGTAIKLFAFVIFLAISSALILFPILLYAIQPERAQVRLTAMETKLNTAIRRLAIVLQGGIGIFLLWQGLVHFSGE